MVVGGSLTRGLDIKLDGDVSIEEMAVGRFITIQGQQRRFFGVVTDVTLVSADPALPQSPPDVSNSFIAQVVMGTSTFGNVHAIPYLSLGLGDDSLLEGPLPAKTVPPHFSLARDTDPKEIQQIFGENDDKHIWIGSPLDMEEAPVCLSVDRVTERSTGVFGKTGTGKSFLTRILLAEIVQKSQAVSLIFDMHNEYGWSARSEDRTEVKGLKQLFQSKVAVFTLDEESARARGLSADFVVQIGYDDISAQDIATLAGTLGLNETQVQAAERLQRRLGQHWLREFLKRESVDDLREMADGTEHEGTIAALHRRLQRLTSLPFLVETPQDNSVRRLMERLERGIHVVVEFGRYTNNLTAYILVANLLTRRIHEQYVDRMERALGKQADEPRPLIIAIEEAHKFLSPEVAGNTAFGTIARELRKYNVTLLVIDQRPSGIDNEIMSQIGTKITCLLDDERDVDAALAGVSGRNELRAVLAKLETKQQALIYGHAVPMPVVVRTRNYDAEFYRSVGSAGAMEPAARRAILDQTTDDLFGKR
jgi:DNA helicase HerA-like ATPase